MVNSDAQICPFDQLLPVLTHCLPPFPHFFSFLFYYDLNSEYVWHAINLLRQDYCVHKCSTGHSYRLKPCPSEHILYNVKIHIDLPVYSVYSYRPPSLIFAFGAHVFITLPIHTQITESHLNAGLCLYSWTRMYHNYCSALLLFNHIYLGIFHLTSKSKVLVEMSSFIKRKLN